MSENPGAAGIRKFFNTTLVGIQDKLQTGASTFYPGPSGAMLKSGWLKKQGGVMRSWHRRWFKLEEQQLHYFSGQDEAKLQGTIWLPGNNLIEHPLNPAKPEEFLFEIVPGKWAKIIPGDRSKQTPSSEAYLMCASSDDERKAWVNALKRVMYGHKGGAIFGNCLGYTIANEVRLRNEPRKVPEIVEMCADFIIQNGLETEGIFRLPGRAALIRELKEKFDTGERPALVLGEHDVPTIASLLKQYLRDLPQPLVTYNLYETVMRVVNREIPLDPDLGADLLREILTQLPLENYNLLQYLCRFLNKVADCEDVNKMTRMNLATVFVHCVIRPEDDDPALLMGTADSRTRCVFFLLTRNTELFIIEHPATAENTTEIAEGVPITSELVPITPDLNSSPDSDASPDNYSIGHDYVHVATTADDLLGIHDNHFAEETDLPKPLTPKQTESSNTLNRRGSRKGRVFNDASYGAADDSFETAEYIDSDTLHSGALCKHAPVDRTISDTNSDFYPGYESVSSLQLEIKSHEQTNRESNLGSHPTKDTSLDRDSYPSSEKDKNSNIQACPEGYSLLSNYSSKCAMVGEDLDDNGYSYLPEAKNNHSILRKKHSAPEQVYRKTVSSSIRPMSSPPKPPAPIPRPRKSLDKKRSALAENPITPECNSEKSDSTSIYSVPFDCIHEKDHHVHMRERASKLLAANLDDLAGREDLLAHIHQLNHVITDQSRELLQLNQAANQNKAQHNTEIKQKDKALASLKASYEKQLEEKDRQIEEERNATGNAVTRVMDLQANLERYKIRYGSVIEADQE